MWTYPFSRYRCTTSRATEDEVAASSVVMSRSAFLYALDVASSDNQDGPDGARSEWPAMASFAVCCGWIVLATRVFGRWLGWLATVSGIGLALSGSSRPVRFGTGRGVVLDLDDHRLRSPAAS